MFPRLATLFLLVAATAPAQRFYTYVGDIGADSVILAWGTTEGKGNTIGRASASHGAAVVRLAGREVTVEERNWVSITGLEPDREYPYEVLLNGRRIGQGSVRTHPINSDELTFMVIGDFGNASKQQREVAAVMAREVEKRRQTDNPVRFVLTTGDNIYGVWFLWYHRTGDRDKHWEKKLFQPYEPVLRHIPFYPTLGNHDGNSSEARGDLPVYLDNFFFPGGQPARYYAFSFGGLADFFALDSTWITESGPIAPAYEPDGAQFKWLNKALGNSRAPWKIPYFHHPPFTAGPNHPPSLDELRHFHDLFSQSGVRVVFNGHEHNLQFSERNDRTGGIQYVISGSGGELRSGRVSGPEMAAAAIAGWAPQHQFLVVEIRDREMKITPLGAEPIRVRGPEGNRVPMPMTLTIR